MKVPEFFLQSLQESNYCWASNCAPTNYHFANSPTLLYFHKMLSEEKVKEAYFWAGKKPGELTDPNSGSSIEMQIVQ